MIVTNQIHGPVVINIFGPADNDGVRPVIGQVEGSHWNVLRSAMTEALEPFVATPDPSNPRALWAGDEIDGETGQFINTVFLRFDDDAKAQEAFEAAGLWLSDTVNMGVAPNAASQ
jgi:hypothetical protein